MLVGTATVISFVAGTLLGVLAAWRRGRVLDTVATVGSSFTAAFPYFWTAMLLLFLFGFTLGWFPIKGAYGAASTPQASLQFIGDAAYHSVLPAITIIASVLGGWVLSMRNNMISVLGADYVTFAEANGLRGRTVALRYAARNALLPNMTLFALALGLVVSGSILTEYVFGYPGVGYLLANAISNRDYPLLQALFLVITVSVLVANFLVDSLYAGSTRGSADDRPVRAIRGRPGPTPEPEPAPARGRSRRRCRRPGRECRAPCSLGRAGSGHAVGGQVRPGSAWSCSAR